MALSQYGRIILRMTLNKDENWFSVLTIRNLKASDSGDYTFTVKTGPAITAMTRSLVVIPKQGQFLQLWTFVIAITFQGILLRRLPLFSIFKGYTFKGCLYYHMIVNKIPVYRASWNTIPLKALILTIVTSGGNGSNRVVSFIVSTKTKTSHKPSKPFNAQCARVCVWVGGCQGGRGGRILPIQ